MKTIKATILGSVQGVLFRNFLKENAQEIEIKGFCRNLDDGRVEVVIEGKDENVNQMLNVCKQGPAQAEIKDVEVEELKHQGFDDFKVLRM